MLSAAAPCTKSKKAIMAWADKTGVPSARASHTPTLTIVATTPEAVPDHKPHLVDRRAQ